MSILKITGLQKRFDDKTILDNFDLEVSSNEFVTIVGKSGCGKTTLLNIIGLLEDATNGSISLFGYNNVKPYSKDARKLLAKKIGFLFQNFALIDTDTVEENLKMVSTKNNMITNDRIDTALKQVGIENLKKQKVYKCSGGEQQRIAIARLLLKECELVLADEPTGSLDSNTKQEVFNLLKLLQRNGKTLIVVTHDEDLMNISDRVIRL